MAASFTIAARNNEFISADSRAVTLASVTAYRKTMLRFAEMGTLNIWYARLSEEDLLRAVKKTTRSTKAEWDEGSRQA